MANEFYVQHGIIVAGNSTNVTSLDFNDSSGASQASIEYDHFSDTFTINVGGTTQITATATAITISGDLTVDGTTTTVSSNDLVVSDNIIRLNDGEGGAGVSLGAAGIVVDRGSSTDAGWFFNETGAWWGPTGPSGIAGEGGATQTIGNIAAIDSTDASQEVLTIVSTGAIRMPSGTTAEQPSSPIASMTRYNTDTNALEVYDGSDWSKILASTSGSPVIVTGDIDLTNTYKILNPLDPTTGNEVGDRDYNDNRYFQITNNFSEVVNAATARTNLDITPANIGAVDITGDTMTGDLIMAADILPDVDYTTTPRDIGKTNGEDGYVGSDLRFRSIHAETFYGTATNALYADLAERYEADNRYEPGTVLVFGGEKEVTVTEMYADTRVAGVVSTNPAFKMNSGAGFSDTHPYIALRGKVPCKVSGYIRKGDLLVTSFKPGYAVSVDSNHAVPYTVFAKANEDFDGDEGIINVSII